MTSAKTNTDITFNKNEDAIKQLISAMEKRFEKTALGGGKTRLEKQHEQGKLSARERLEYLFDKESQRIEIGAFAGDEMYPEHGGCPSGGVVVMIGYVNKKQCIVVANDATVKAGAWFPITGKKHCVHRKSQWKIICRLFISLTALVFICQCKMKSFRIRKTLEGFFAIMPSCLPKEFFKSPQ